MKNIFILLLLFTTYLPNLQAQDEPTDEDILYLMELTRVGEQFENLFEQTMAKEMETYKASEDSTFYLRYYERISSSGFDEIKEDYIQVYKETLTDVEVKALIKFYQSDLGKTVIEKFPVLLEKTSQIGDEYGGRVSLQILGEIKLENEELFRKEIPEDCSKFRTGNFEYETYGVYTKVKRTEQQQTEYAMGVETTLKIEWISNNRYKIYQNYEGKEGMETAIIEVNIYEVNGNDYKYIAKTNLMEEYTFGEISKID